MSRFVSTLGKFLSDVAVIRSLFRLDSPLRQSMFYFFALQRASILHSAASRSSGRGGGNEGKGYKRKEEGLPWTEEMRGVRREERRGSKNAKGRGKMMEKKKGG